MPGPVSDSYDPEFGTSENARLVRDEVMTESVHDYLSTACLHECHADCRAKCKFCSAICRCEECGHECEPTPIPMLLWCPNCGERHIDDGEFSIKPHHTHACQNCGMVWRPSRVSTVGVRFLPGFKNAKGEST